MQDEQVISPFNHDPEYSSTANEEYKCQTFPELLESQLHLESFKFRSSLIEEMYKLKQNMSSSMDFGVFECQYGMDVVSDIEQPNYKQQLPSNNRKHFKYQSNISDVGHVDNTPSVRLLCEEFKLPCDSSNCSTNQNIIAEPLTRKHIPEDYQFQLTEINPGYLDIQQTTDQSSFQKNCNIVTHSHNAGEQNDVIKTIITPQFPNTSGNFDYLFNPEIHSQVQKCIPEEQEIHKDEQIFSGNYENYNYYINTTEQSNIDQSVMKSASTRYAEFKFPYDSNEQMNTELSHRHSRSRNNSVRTAYETDYEGSINNLTLTTNTESFSELIFTTSDSNYSDSESERGNEKRISSDINLIEQFPDLLSFEHHHDDTSGILYKLSEQINKVPELLHPLSHCQNNSEEFLLGSIESSLCSDSGSESLEQRVNMYFTHSCTLTDIPQLTGLQNSRGNEELEQLEAAVERMLSQVDIQENLLKKDLSFVPLVVESKEMKALPILVDTLCISPQPKRKLTHDESSGTDKEISPSLMSFMKTCNSQDYDDLEGSSCEKLPSCSINDLELTVSKLLLDVEKEEAKLSNDERKYMHSADEDTVSDDENCDVWWEGAFRSLPRNKHSGETKIKKKLINMNRDRYFSQKFKYLTSSDEESESSEIDVTSNILIRISDEDRDETKTEKRYLPRFAKTSRNKTSKFSHMFSLTPAWNRSLPTLYDESSTDKFKNLLVRSSGSDNSIYYQQNNMTDFSTCVQYFTPVPTTQVNNSGYCTWSRPRGKTRTSWFHA